MSNMRVFFKKIKVLGMFYTRNPLAAEAGRFCLFSLPESGFNFVINMLFGGRKAGSDKYPLGCFI